MNVLRVHLAQQGKEVLKAPERSDFSGQHQFEIILIFDGTVFGV